MIPPGVASIVAELSARSGVTLVVAPIDAPGKAGDSTAARQAKSRALAAIGSTAAFMDGHHDDGRPCWPADATGSLAHAGEVALAGAMTANDATSAIAVGVDVERSGALPAIDARLVFNAAEQLVLDAQPASSADRYATLVWSVKEAAFKAWCEATGGQLGDVDPCDIHVELDDASPDDPIGVRVVHAGAHGALAASVARIGPLDGVAASADGYDVVVVTSRRCHGHGADGMASAAITSPSAPNATA